MGVVFDVKEGTYASDGTVLSRVGIPSVSFTRVGGPPLHTVEDTVRWLKPQALQVQGEFVEHILTRYVADAAAFPFEREIPEQQRKVLESGARARI